jgi:SAM-dependent methyltransferase
MTDRTYADLHEAHTRPAPFSVYTTARLWTDEHISVQMLNFHLDPGLVAASRPAATIARSIDWMRKRFDLGSGKRIIDFGCGPGLYTTSFAQLGASVTGIDFSARSLAHARSTAAASGLSIDYVEADYRQYHVTGTADLVTLIYCDFCALPPTDRHSLLCTFRDLLAAGGHLVLDVASTSAFAARQETVLFCERLLDGFWAAGPYYGLMRTFLYDDEFIGLDRYTIWQPDQRWEVYNWMQYFTPDSLAAEFAAAGLRLVETLGDVCGSVYNPEAEEFAVVATV